MMLSLLFYFLVGLTLIAVIALFFYQRRQTKNHRGKKRAPLFNFDSPDFTKTDQTIVEQKSEEFTKQSPYNPDLIVLQINAFPGKPYMGYELHQALLSAGLRFGEMNIFHRYSEGDKGNVLFSLAAATSNGSFVVEDIGSFKCGGLLLFMNLASKQKLMESFDLMLDTARQLTEELGGEIYDDLQQLINADVIKRLREKICTVETNNFYVSDLLDNLD